jgi:uncharacterized membrane protein YfcA
MKGTYIIRIVIGGIITAIVGFVVALLAIKLLWSWIVPELFPKAVEENLIVRNLSWLGAIKVAIVVGILSGVKYHYTRKKSCHRDRQ